MMHIIKCRRACMLLYLLPGLTGCAAGLPTYTWRTPAEALHIIRMRNERIHTICGQGRVTLVESQAGQATVNLDVAVVAQPPGHFRLRAWKLGRAVMDVTVTPRGVWAWFTPRGKDQLQARFFANDKSSHRFKTDWLTTLFVYDDNMQVLDHTDNQLILQRTIDSPRGSTIQLHIDPRTQALQKCKIFNAEGYTDKTITFSKYRLIDDIIWPMSVTAVSDKGKIIFKFTDVEINSTLNPKAFDPSTRSKKILNPSK